jgi:hypothetical protein
MKEEDFLLLL